MDTLLLSSGQGLSRSNTCCSETSCTHRTSCTRLTILLSQVSKIFKFSWEPGLLPCANCWP